MMRLKGLMAITGAAVGLTLTAVGPATASPYFQNPYGQAPYGAEHGPMQLQDLIARTQTDLRAAQEYATSGKQRDRTKNAEKHLSDFDKRLTEGHWNHNQLNDAISSVQGVLDHNTLNAADRDRLLHDVEELRIVRDRR
jgi:hypothetical protein